MSKIDNAIRGLNKTVTLRKTKFLGNILDLLKEYNYIGSYDVVDDGRQGLIKVNLLGNINKCGIIKPRFSVTVEEIESYEKRFLPAKDFGVVIISTSKGLMTQTQAKEAKVGGTLVAYCY